VVNFVSYSEIAYPTAVEIPVKNSYVYVVIQITTKIWSAVASHISRHSEEFH